MLQAGKRRIIMWQLFMSTLHDILTIRHLSWVCHPDLLVCDFIVTNLGSVTCWHQSLQVWTWIRACAGHPTNSILVLITQFSGSPGGWVILQTSYVKSMTSYLRQPASSASTGDHSMKREREKFEIFLFQPIRKLNEHFIGGLWCYLVNPWFR